jgi:hypothetical protein
VVPFSPPDRYHSLAVTSHIYLHLNLHCATTEKIKTKLSLRFINHHAMKTYGGRWRHLHGFFRWSCGQLQTSKVSSPVKRTRTQWIGGWEKDIFLLPSIIEHRFLDSETHIRVTISTEKTNIRTPNLTVCLYLQFNTDMGQLSTQNVCMYVCMYVTSFVRISGGAVPYLYDFR